MRVHPPFATRTDLPGGPDACSLQGAARIAARIKDAWAECGHAVAPAIEPIGNGMGWAVRLPDLVNGLPTQQATPAGE
jgi:hypothetical protein